MTLFCDVCCIYVEASWVRDHVAPYGKQWEVYVCPWCGYEIKIEDA